MRNATPNFPYSSISILEKNQEKNEVSTACDKYHLLESFIIKCVRFYVIITFIEISDQL